MSEFSSIKPEVHLVIVPFRFNPDSSIWERERIFSFFETWTPSITYIW